MGVCPTLRSKIADTGTPPIRHIYVDLSAADFIDSTFTGFLLSLRRGQADAGPTLHLVAPTAGVLRTLETMQVRRLMDIVSELPESVDRWEALATDPLDASQSCELVIDAHEALIDADESNRAKFGHVVELFRKDLEDKHDADNAS